MKKNYLKKGVCIALTAAIMFVEATDGTEAAYVKKTYEVEVNNGDSDVTYYNDGAIKPNKKHTGKYIVKAKKRSVLNDILEETDEIVVTDEITNNIVEVDVSDDDIEEISDNYDDIIIEENYIVEASKAGQKKIKAKKKVKTEKDTKKSKYVDKWNRRIIDMDKIPESNDAGVEQKKVKVAILDSGVSALSDVQVEKRINLVDNSSIIYEDGTDHGTNVASVIASLGDIGNVNGTDRSGIEIYSVKVLDDNNTAPVSRIIEGINWAVENDVDIINMSFGTINYSEILNDAIQKAYKAGVVLIAAAGNGDSVEYPAAFEEVIAVGSIDSTGVTSEVTSLGDEIDLMAPGENVVVTGMFGARMARTGTSFAAPHVAVAASIIKKEHPDLSNKEIMELLKLSATEMDEEGTGSGIVNVKYALDNYNVYTEHASDNKAYDEDLLSEIERCEMVDTTDDALVEARWIKEKDDEHPQQEGHVELVDNAKDLYDGDLYLTNTEWTHIRKAVKQIDMKFASKSNETNPNDNHEYLHAHNNYIANYRYLTYVANYIYWYGYTDYINNGQKKMDNADYKLINEYFIKKIKDKYKDEKGFDWLNNKEGLSHYIIGAALHCAADVYAHRAYGYNEKANCYYNIDHNDNGEERHMVGADDSTVIPERYEDAKQVTYNILDKYFHTADDGTYTEFIKDNVTYSNYKLQLLYEYSYQSAATYNHTISGSSDAKLWQATISKFNIKDIKCENNGTSINVTCRVPNGSCHVWFPTWTKNNGQDDLVWHGGSYEYDPINDITIASCTINMSDHNNESGIYIIHIYVFDKNLRVITSVAGSPIAMGIYDVKKTEGYGYYTVTCKVPEGTSRVSFPAWTQKNGQDDLVWHEGTLDRNTNTATCKISTSYHNYQLGCYITHIYAYDASGNVIGSCDAGHLYK